LIVKAAVTVEFAVIVKLAVPVPEIPEADPVPDHPGVNE